MAIGIEYYATDVDGNDLPGPFYAVHEPASTNLLDYSTEIESWSSNIRVTVEITNDFFGIFQARNIVPTTDNDTHLSAENVPIDNLGYYTFWCIAEAAGEDVFVLNVYDSIFGSGAQCAFDLSAKTALPAGNNASGGIEEVHPGIFYCWYTVEATATGANYSSIVPRTTGAYAGDGVSGIKVYHCQMEYLAFPTSPIITDGAAASRDVCKVNHSSVGRFNQQEGMCIVKMKAGWAAEVIGHQIGIVSLKDYGTPASLQYFNVGASSNPISSYDDTNGSTVYPPDWGLGDELVVVTRWNAALNELQVGVKNITQATGWIWDTSVGNYDGDFVDNGAFHLAALGVRINRFETIHVYNKDKGISFIEANY